MNVGTKRTALIISLACLLAAPWLFGDTAFAQAGGEDGEKTLAEQIEEITVDLDAREKELADLRKQLAKTKDSVAGDALKSELMEKEGRFRREVAELTDLVVAGDKDDATDTTKARALAERLLTEDANKIRKGSADAARQVLELAEVVENGTPEEADKARSERDRAIVDANDLLRQFNDSIGQRKLLSMDVETDVTIISEQLKKRATFVAGYLQSTSEEIDDISSRPGVDQDADAQKSLADLGDRRDVLAKSQRLNVELMDEYCLETAELRRGIISATGKISEDVLDKDVAVGLVEEWMADAGEWLRTNGASLVFQGVMFLLVLLAFWILAKIARGAVRRALNRSKVGISSLAKNFFINSTGRLIMLLGVIIAIAQLGIEVGPLLAGLGIAGFVVGFALQDTLSNFASGMMILIYRPFDVGDVIEAGGVTGKVHQMNLVSTMVLTFDNQLLVVPNNQIWGGVIRNVTHQDKRRVDMTFGIGYSDDIPAAEKVLADVVGAHEKVLKDPEPVIRLHELGDSSVNFIVRPWSKTDDYWDVYWDITREVKHRFDQEGISIPFPQRDVHVFHETAPAPHGDDSSPTQTSTAQSGQDVVPDNDGND
ncbi:MAG: mechanosensitive ion channel domain-containing protein [Myxococcota bacterium]